MLTDVKQTRQGIIATLIPSFLIGIAVGILVIALSEGIHLAVQHAVKELLK